MRADRLVAILLLLQRHGIVTAAQVAEELEVSERTARRDLDALGQAGLPVYATQGRGGGWRLAGGGKTDLSGLSAAEARALFLVAGPHAAATPELRAALRKLVRALPEPLRERAEAASAALVIDPDAWDRGARSRRPIPPLLDAVQAAVVNGERVRLGYVARNGAETTRAVDPLGVVAKGASWYLVAGTEAGQRTFRVDRVSSVAPTGERARRPEGFDLAEAWRAVRDQIDELRAPVVATGWATPIGLQVLPLQVGSRFSKGPTGPDGRTAVELRGHSVRSLVGEIAGLGDMVEVTGPPEVRAALAGVAAELLGLYGPSPTAPT